MQSLSTTEACTQGKSALQMASPGQRRCSSPARLLHTRVWTRGRQRRSDMTMGWFRFSRKQRKKRRCQTQLAIIAPYLIHLHIHLSGQGTTPPGKGQGGPWGPPQWPSPGWLLLNIPSTVDDSRASESPPACFFSTVRAKSMNLSASSPDPDLYFSYSYA